ncbi:MAG: hypothetical protein DCF15_02170 [Phormidesmis priestleyi]|uniref:Uncharacterized protein n=1 Tax=Phormidesmis priestleyi TaxID=268141 RepID=A0A2W4ZQ65_9CYAN|nr:MAG: hypothetical protein DCF15_02170 [Phormidesmis priestleyi]
MAYSDFSLATVRDRFELTLDESKDLFAQVSPVAPSETLKIILDDYIPLATAIATEKARSEFLIAPLLAEVRRQFHNRISLFSGNEFPVDLTQGLHGFCDYIMSDSPEQLLITAPVMTIVEAKRENILGGLGQCIAAMVAAQIFNQQAGKAVEIIYGAVTTGTNWKFLQIQAKTVSIDKVEYFINQPEKILGILMEPFQPVGQAV